MKVSQGFLLFDVRDTGVLTSALLCPLFLLFVFGFGFVDLTALFAGESTIGFPVLRAMKSLMFPMLFSSLGDYSVD